MKNASDSNQTYALVALILFQAGCAAFFLGDVADDIVEFAAGDSRLHIGIEMAATVSLIAGIVIEAFLLSAMLRRAVKAEKTVDVAQGALHDVIESYFRDWHLTPSERDVAAFTIKGYSISEIAEFRKSAEGTIKTHLNAIYRKAGVAGRSQLVSLLIEDLISTPLIDAEEPDRRIAS